MIVVGEAEDCKKRKVGNKPPSLFCLLQRLPMSVRVAADSAASLASASLRQVQVVMRHGDRTPSFNAFSGSGPKTKEAIQMAQFWESRTLRASLGGGLGSLKLAAATNANAQTFDHSAYPFQSLTEVGARQALRRGSLLGAKYADFLRGERGGARLRARASNFSRTQSTAAYFYRGLADTLGEEFQAPAIVSIDAREETIFPMETERGLKSALAEAYSSDIFRERENRHAAVAQQFAELVPFFSRMMLSGGEGAASSTAAALNRSPVKNSRFLWIRAHDLFVCHRAHGAPIPHFNVLEEHELLVRAHLLWRYETLYGNKRVLSCVAGPLLKDILEGMLSHHHHPHHARPEAAAATRQAVPFILYGGHDLTILSLLIALTGASANNVQLQWPKYAATLRFELHAPASPAASNDWMVSWECDNEAISPTEVGDALASSSHSPPPNSLRGRLSLRAFQQLAQDFSPFGDERA